MSIRTYKTSLKRLNKADQDAKNIVESARLDDEENHSGRRESMLHGYARDALAYARALYYRTRREKRKLRPSVLVAI